MEIYTEHQWYRGKGKRGWDEGREEEKKERKEKGRRNVWIISALGLASLGISENVVIALSNIEEHFVHSPAGNNILLLKNKTNKKSPDNSQVPVFRVFSYANKSSSSTAYLCSLLSVAESSVKAAELLVHTD